MEADTAGWQPSDLPPVEERALQAEIRVNLIRAMAIAGFYLIHLLHVMAPGWGSDTASWIGFGAVVDPKVHIAVSLLCLGWLMQAFSVHLLVAQRQVGDVFALASTLGDLAWMTAILSFSTGPAGPMVLGYFLIIMLAGLRFNLRLIRVTTVGAIVAYAILLGVARWPAGLIGTLELQTVPRYQQLMVALGLAVAGIIMGQMVRMAWAFSATPSTSKEEVAR